MPKLAGAGQHITNLKSAECVPHNFVTLPQNMVPVAEAQEVRHAAEAREAVEAAQAAASAALAAELEVARKGRADAESREAALQEEVPVDQITDYETTASTYPHRLAALNVWG